MSKAVFRPMFIDTDTASDDAVALVMALRHPAVDVVGIGIVAGNVPLDMGVQNALYTVEMCGANVPVYAGCSEPLECDLRTAQMVHGKDGMGDIGLSLQGRVAQSQHAVDALLEASNRFAGELEVVTLGPLTNIATALRRDPDLASRIKRCVVMGAVYDHIGNVTPVAEFNMWCDPLAAQVVLDSGLKPEFVGWDRSRFDAVIDSKMAASIRSIGTPLAEFAIDIQRAVIEFCRTETKIDGFDLPDPIAMAHALDDTVALETRELFCEVETRSGPTEGMVVMDVLGVLHRPANAKVVTRASNARFIEMLREAVR